MKHKRFRIYIICSIFIGILFFPIINQGFSFVKDAPNLENRAKAKKPVLNIERLDPFPSRYEKYYNDNFSIRSLLIGYFNLFNLYVFNKSPFLDKVTIGKDGWLYFTGEEMDTYFGNDNLKKAELYTYKTELEYRKKYLKERGCEFYFLIAPTKPNIYPENIPYKNYNLDKKSRGEELLDYLNDSSDVETINVYNTLRENKKNGQMYFKLDNHWNSFGAFYATSEFIKVIQPRFPSILPLILDSFNIKKTEINTGNTATILGNSKLFKDLNYQLSPKSGFKAKEISKVGYVPEKDFPYPNLYEMRREIKNSKQPKLLVISDSFGDDAFPFLSENFNTTLKIWDNWKYKLNEDIVNKEKPDIYLLIIHEKNLRLFLKK